MKYLLAPDSFKGTLSSEEACEIMKSAIISVDSEAETDALPVADGGEGSVAAFLSVSGGEKVDLKVKDPFFDETEVFYGLTPDGTAIIEMAQAAGLPLAGDRKNPMTATTYGVGEMIEDAVLKGAEKIILCIGGSATNDAGCGMAAAMGAEFYDEKGDKFIPAGGTLCKIRDIKLDNMREKYGNVTFTTMCDVNNPLYGPMGAAYVFAKQKGASEEELPLLDAGLVNFAEVVKEKYGTDLSGLKGGGAAGGMGAGCVFFMKSELKSGIDTLLDFADFDERAKKADCILTGEGKTDGQSLCGKVICGIAQKAKKTGTPVIAVSGCVEDGEIEEFYKIGLTAAFSINRKAEDFSVSAGKTRENLYYTVQNIVRLFTGR